MGETKKQKKKTQPRRKQKPEMPSCFVTDMDQYLFGQGNHYDIFRKLGAHTVKHEGKKAFILQSGRLMPIGCM